MTTRGGPTGPLVALVLVTAIVGCGAPTVAPTASPGAAPSPDGPTSTAASPSPPTATDEPTSEPIATPEAGWIRLADAPDAGAAWSPDSAHLLVWTAAGGPPESHLVRLMTRAGEMVRQFEQVTDPVWVDANRFVSYRLDWRQDESGEWHAKTGPNGERLGTALAGDLGSAELAEVELPLGAALSNGRGTLAVAQFDAAGAAQYALWSDGEMTDWQPGYPTSWSAAGDRLLLVHARDVGPGAEGWLEVVDGASRSTVWASAEDLRVGMALFDPTGAYLAYPEYVERPRQPRQVPEFDLIVRVVDLASGDVGGFPAQENGIFAWDESGSIVVVGFDSQQATVYDRDGNELVAESVAGPAVVASPDGSTLLFYDAELDEPQMQVLRGGTLRMLGSPGTLAGPAPRLAPDGSGLLVVVRLPSNAPQGPPATVLVHAL